MDNTSHLKWYSIECIPRRSSTFDVRLQSHRRQPSHGFIDERDVYVIHHTQRPRFTSFTRPHSYNTTLRIPPEPQHSHESFDHDLHHLPPKPFESLPKLEIPSPPSPSLHLRQPHASNHRYHTTYSDGNEAEEGLGPDNAFIDGFEVPFADRPPSKSDSELHSDDEEPNLRIRQIQRDEEASDYDESASDDDFILLNNNNFDVIDLDHSRTRSAAMPDRSKTKELEEEFNYTEVHVLPTKYGPDFDLEHSSTELIVQSVHPVDGVADALPRPRSRKDGRRHSTARPPPQFKWLHLQQDYMNFQKFKEFAFACADHSVEDRKELVKLFDKIQEKVTPLEAELGEGRKMEPWFECLFARDSGVCLQKTYLWLCFPYLDLEKYDRAKPEASRFDHPPQALVQSHYSDTSKERELSQTLAQRSSVSSKKCLHVSQLWSLVVNKDTLITCARHPLEELQGDLLRHTKSDNTDATPYVKLTDGGNAIYLLSPAYCQTWFDLTAQLHQNFGGPSKAYKVFEQGGASLDAETFEDLQIAQSSYGGCVVLKLKPQDCTLSAGTTGGVSSSIARSDNVPGSDMDGASNRTADPLLSPSPVSPTSSSATNHRPSLDIGSSGSQLLPGTAFGKSSRAENIVLGRSASDMDDELEERLRSFNWNDDLQIFRVFTWLSVKTEEKLQSQVNGRRQSNSRRSQATENEKAVQVVVQHELLEKNLREMHNRQRSSLKSKKTKNYRDTPQCSYVEFRKALHEDVIACKAQPLSGPVGIPNQTGQRRSFETAEELANAAEGIYQLFLPLADNSELSQKFWGGIGRITHQIMCSPEQKLPEIGLEQIKSFADAATELREKLSYGRAQPPSEAKVPHAFYQGFASLLTFVTSFQPIREDFASWRTYLHRYDKKFWQGHLELVAQVGCGNLKDQEAILPTGVLGIIVTRLLRDVTGSGSNFVFNEYRDKLRRLENGIHEQPKNRQTDLDLMYVGQELKAIYGITSQQRDLVGALHKVLGSESMAACAAQLGMREGRASTIASVALQTVKQKLADFDRLSRKRDIIVDEHDHLLRTSKDDQEAASLIFAIVSVIFLPLTTVASFLGMNTKGVRDMEQGSWVFWAVGLPLATLTGLFCLWATSQFVGFREWSKKKLPRLIRASDSAARIDHEEQSQVASKRTLGGESRVAGSQFRTKGLFHGRNRVQRDGSRARDVEVGLPSSKKPI